MEQEEKDKRKGDRIINKISTAISIMISTTIEAPLKRTLLLL